MDERKPIVTGGIDEIGARSSWSGVNDRIVNSMQQDCNNMGARVLQAEDDSADRKPRKQKIMSFKRGRIFMALKMVSPFIKEKNEYGEAFPRITFLVDGRYVRLPIESDTLQELGSFMMKMGKALEGVKVSDDELNMDRIRDRIRACGGVIAKSADDRE